MREKVHELFLGEEIMTLTVEDKDHIVINYKGETDVVKQSDMKLVKGSYQGIGDKKSVIFVYGNKTVDIKKTYMCAMDFFIRELY